MIIKQITLENYRIYSDKNEVSLPSVEGKNVYIISGNNGFGKTTFLTSLVWCLYGKLIGAVDEKYKREIFEAGGYKEFAKRKLNREANSRLKELLKENLVSLKAVDPINYEWTKSEIEKYSTLSVTVDLAEVNIPAMLSDQIRIKRSFNILKGKDDLQILVNGKESELTREVGNEIFINDFILPKEIAKFFFFDAEKIVALAEMKSIEDKRNLSRAYSEVLGIKKYEDLKSNLEDLRVRFRRATATKKDKEKYQSLLEEINRLGATVDYKKERISQLAEELGEKQNLSDEWQEKLIREGNSLSVEDLKVLKTKREKLTKEYDEIKLQLKEILDLAPFALAGSKMLEVSNQLEIEAVQSKQTFSPDLLKKKISAVENSFTDQIESLKIDKKTVQTLKSTFKELLQVTFLSAEKEAKILLDFTESERNEFNAVLNNLKYSYSEVFKRILEQHKENRIVFNKVIREIQEAEGKENDPLIQSYRQSKSRIDHQIDEINKEIYQLEGQVSFIQNENASKSKVHAELEKKIKLDVGDQKKDEVAKRLIKELDEFLLKLKNEKKNALESKLKSELNRLMHKKTFVDSVEVSIDKDLIDIHLRDKKGDEIRKEMLSKGEQQLYATAVLKSLVDESQIEFPIFIDSPLQKLDKNHASNIINEFYPSVSRQVILFPLLNTELTETDYAGLLPKVNKTYLIENLNSDQSTFIEIKPSELFKTNQGKEVANV